MHDDFLHRLRKDPSPEFAFELRARLRRQSRAVRTRRAPSLLRTLIVALLLGGAAFAATYVAIRGMPTPLMSSPRHLLRRITEGRRIAASSAEPAGGAAQTAQPRASRSATSPERAASGREAAQTALSASRATAEAISVGVASAAPARVSSPAPGALATAASPGRPVSPQKQAQRAVKVRQALFDVQNFAFNPLRAMLKGGPFNTWAAITAGQRIEITSSMIPDVFKVDTSGLGLKTKARAGIWNNIADFDRKAANLHDAAVDLAAVAKTGDMPATLAAAGAVGKACGACHDEYKDK
ncbi:MAG: cytochrome c [Steroidobacteraceae bacterium]